MKTNLFLCSFASSDLDLSVERFVAQAKKLNIYCGIKVFRPKDLSSELNNRINRLIKDKGRYLYGYEIWKQKIISEYLKNIPENVILQYSDIGCHFNDSGIKRLNDYVSITEKDKRTDYPGREIANFVETEWNNKFNNKISAILGNEWHGGNLSYHLKSRPKWIFESDLISSCSSFEGTLFKPSVSNVIVCLVGDK